MLTSSVVTPVSTIIKVTEEPVVCYKIKVWIHITVQFFIFLTDDESRVRLRAGDNDYINATFVEAPEAGRRYILAQVCSKKSF